MARPKTKDELLTAANLTYEKLTKLWDGFTPEQTHALFPEAVLTKGSERHWQRDKCLRDVVIHLHEWHNLLITWVEANQAAARQNAAGQSEANEAVAEQSTAETTNPGQGAASRVAAGQTAAKHSSTSVAFFPEPYNWRNYGELNEVFVVKHQRTTYEEARGLLAASHERVLGMIEGFGEEELFTKKYFEWTGTTSLGSYFVSATSAHYEWAAKKTRAYARALAA